MSFTLSPIQNCRGGPGPAVIMHIKRSRVETPREVLNGPGHSELLELDSRALFLLKGTPINFSTAEALIPSTSLLKHSVLSR